MEYDVFISYSHHDDTTNQGWIAAFQTELKNRYKSRTGLELRLFFDNSNLQVGDVLATTLKKAMDGAILFMPILSPPYLSSKWCRKEFLHFLDSAGAGVIVGGKSRIIPIELHAYHRDFTAPDSAEQAEVERIRDYFSKQDVLYASFFKGLLPIAPTEEVFKERIATLAGTIHTSLKALQAPEVPVVKTDDMSWNLGVFLGYAYGSSAGGLRKKLAKEWASMRQHALFPARILPEDTGAAPENPKEWSKEDLSQFIKAQLEQSAVAVLLYDDLDGGKPAGEERTRIAHLQYELALEQLLSRPNFRIYVGDLTTSDCSEERMEFRKKVAADARENERVLLFQEFDVATGGNEVAAYIQELSKPSEPVIIGAAAYSPKRVLLVHDRRDKGDKVLNNIDDLIFDHQFEVFKPVFAEDDPLINPDEVLKKYWSVSNRAIVLLRNATTAWCNATKADLLAIAKVEKPAESYAMAVCVADPDASERLREVRSNEFTIINATTSNYQQEILNFLNAPSHD